MENIKDLLNMMSPEQKIQFLAGDDFWNIHGEESLNIPSVMVTDGPHGLRKQNTKADHLGFNESVPATCFPTASAIASSWDTNLINNIGIALAEECLNEKIAILLGPGANIKRSPLCGRNFEYFSEDPYLSGKMAAAFIKGVQSKGIGTSLKHFVVNNQETNRMTIDTIVDDRALREIYLAGFEEAVKTAKPVSVMAAYNKLNGVYCSENMELLTYLLREEWGFEGMIVTDWGAANDRIAGLLAGLDLEMPGPSTSNIELIKNALKNKKISIDTIDNSLERILNVISSTSEALSANADYDIEEHHLLAKKVLCESAVLLKNENILPLEQKGKIAVIGAFAKEPRYQGSGSSRIKPTKINNAWDSINNLLNSNANIIYSAGYDPVTDKIDQTLIDEAVKCAELSDNVIIFAGLPEIFESEGFDRKNINLTESHNMLINSVSNVNKNCIVILSNGAPVSMPWINNVKAVLETYLGGQAWGAACADLIFGIENPSGKLAETFPMSLEDVPSTVNFPGGNKTVAYAESIYVGYRYYEKTKTKVLFPFGHGLSYTNFEYSNISTTTIDENYNIAVSFDIKNTGTVAGKEIVQLYVKDKDSVVFKPEKELKSFDKISLQPGETKTITFNLDKRSFSFWDSSNSSWIVESGDYEILVGSSSTDIRLNHTISIENGNRISDWVKNLKYISPGYYKPEIANFKNLSPSGDFAKFLGKAIPQANKPIDGPFNRLSTMKDISTTRIGKIILKMMLKESDKRNGKNNDETTQELMHTMIKEMPLRALATMGGEDFTIEMVDGIITMLNDSFFKGLKQITAARKNS
ncbi:MAG: glycoside hydrolase family 3 C-terminal domain-containing protein [Spirochaetales bacterium]|nr:glycoside hydrolase family 3 C-terminal domain-containing protein [Spirochaetales bacterium]